MPSLEENVAVITCARADPRETRSGREGGRVHEGVPCSPPSHRAITDLAAGSVRVDTNLGYSHRLLITGCWGVGPRKGVLDLGECGLSRSA
jgi:hypothetical protein